MKNLISSIYFNRILKYPLISISALIFFMFLASSQIGNFRLDASADSLILENDKDLRIYRETISKYASEDFVILTLTPENSLVFDQKNLQIIGAIKKDILSIDGVSSVNSIIDVPLIESSDIPIAEMINNIPNILSNEIDIEKAKKEILESPVYKNLIISEDATTTAIQINIKRDEELAKLNQERIDLGKKSRISSLDDNEKDYFKKIISQYKKQKITNDQRIHNILEDIRNLRDMYEKDFEVEIKIGGIPMIVDDMIGYVKSDLINFGFGVFIFIIITLIIIFKKFKWVMLPILSCIYSVLIMIGILGYLEWEVTVISSNFISLMLILTLSMNIHVIVRYRQLHNQVQDTKKLLSQAVTMMVWPCLYTALTTMVAFASLVFSDIKPVIDFGYMMVMGLLVTFLTTFILLPCLIKLVEPDENNSNNNLQFNFTKYLADFTIAKPIIIRVTSFLILFISVYGITQLRVENSFINYFKSDTEIYQGMKQIDDKLGGTTPLDVVITFPEEDDIDEQDDIDSELLDDDEPSESDWFTVKKINKIKLVHDYLDSQPEIGKVLSLASTVRVAEKINDGKELSSIEMALLYQRAPDKVKSIAVTPYISIKDNEARLNVRVLDSRDDLRRKELIERLEFDLINKLDMTPDEFTITGILILYNNMLQSLFDSQILSLGFVMIGIFLMFLVLFKSATIAVVGIIPNLLAASFVLGLMGLLKIPLDMMTITIAAITVGIAVDNSIHYIYRFKEEFIVSKDYHTALKKSHNSIGRAIFFTSITIIFGFSVLILSNFIPTIIFGVLTGLAMFIAMIAVLTLLPRLIIYTKPFS